MLSYTALYMHNSYFGNGGDAISICLRQEEIGLSQCAPLRACEIECELGSLHSSMAGTLPREY